MRGSMNCIATSDGCLTGRSLVSKTCPGKYLSHDPPACPFSGPEQQQDSKTASSSSSSSRTSSGPGDQTSGYFLGTRERLFPALDVVPRRVIGTSRGAASLPFPLSASASFARHQPRGSPQPLSPMLQNTLPHYVYLTSALFPLPWARDMGTVQRDERMKSRLSLTLSHILSLLPRSGPRRAQRRMAPVSQPDTDRLQRNALLEFEEGKSRLARELSTFFTSTRAQNPLMLVRGRF
ncbi:hypothetical protein LZ31DRAFT_264227 [Colletotrichum somersetense]|nr:hypothetical protein LZ31DRAFT_264227 [Colletotrichum somersetense]